MKRAAVIVALALLAACGRKGELKPKAGMSAPPAPYGRPAPMTTAQGLTPPPDAGPTRVDDVIRRPELERGDDPFDLPPPGAGR